MEHINPPPVQGDNAGATDMAIPAYPGFRPFVAPPEMGFAGRVLTAFTTYPNGRTFFNATMLCKTGREFNAEKTGDDAKKEIVFWERKHKSLISAIAELANQRPSLPQGSDGHVTAKDLIDTTHARKQTGPVETRGTFVDAILFPALARYISDRFAFYTDSITARYVTGDYTVLKEVIKVCDNFHGVRTENIQIDMSEYYAEQERRYKERESELEERVSFWKRTSSDLQDTLAICAKRMRHMDEITNTMPQAITANTLPDNPDHSALDGEGNKYLRDRLYNFPRAVSAAMYEGDTKGASSFVKDYIGDVLNIDVVGMGDTVGVIGADMIIQRAIKLRSAVGWGKVVLSTEITARQAFTVINSTAEWMKLNVPGTTVVSEFKHQANVFRNRYEGLTPSSMEPRLVLELGKKGQRAADTQ